MPVWNLSAEVSDFRHAQVEELCGDKIELNQFLLYALDIGLGHIEEEFVINKRARSYDDLRHATGHFSAVVEKHQMKVSQPPQTPASVTAFGNGLTRRNAG